MHHHEGLVKSVAHPIGNFEPSYWTKASLKDADDRTNATFRALQLVQAASWPISRMGGNTVLLGIDLAV
jgi:hypothetical protein